MTHPPAARPVCHRRRNLCSLALVFAAAGVVYANYDPTPAGGSIEEKVDLAEVTKSIEVPEFSDVGKAASHKKNTLHGRTAMLMNLMLLEKAIVKLQKIDNYSGTFYKRELVKGTLTDAQVMQVKVRHKPFSVYMKWLSGDKGRELLYVDGENDNEMVIRLGGGGRVIPPLKLNPTGDKAMSEARYPITDMGLLNLAKKIAGYRRKDLAAKKLPKCVMFDNQILNDRKCYCFVIEYESQAESKEYRKSIIFIDKQHLVPVCVQNFSWDAESKSGPERDKATLIEDYRYSGLRLDSRLADAEFTRDHKAYRLR